MNSVNNLQRSAGANSDLLFRSVALFTNFFLIILAYYQVKSASRSLLLEYGGSGLFPYAWIISALTLLSLIGIYHQLVEKLPRVRVVLGSLVVFATALIAFRWATTSFTQGSALAFYVFVDIFSVILVEQFWSLTDSINDGHEGKKSFWFVGTGGLVGGVVGGLLAGAIVEHTALTTPDLLYVCAGVLMITFALNLLMSSNGMYRERLDNGGHNAAPLDAPPNSRSNWRTMIGNRYLQLIALLLCLSQLAQPIIEFQFISAVEQRYTTLDARTAFLGQFFGAMGLVSIGVNLIATPLIHRYLGIFAGLAVQPIAIIAASFGFLLQPGLYAAIAMKIGDRGLSYSINRASKEQLYIPVDPVETYQAKAWIDMLGYRLFKVLGSGLIIVTTSWLPIALTVPQLSMLTIMICAVWIVAIVVVSNQYQLQLAAT